MHKTIISVLVMRPRNSVVRAIINKLCAGSGRHVRTRDKRKQGRDDHDLAQRVRDVGEW